MVVKAISEYTVNSHSYWKFSALRHSFWLSIFIACCACSLVFNDAWFIDEICTCLQLLRVIICSR